MTKVFGAALLSAAFAFCCFASGEETKGKDQSPPAKKFDLEEVFKKLDKDGNGKLSREEFLKMADKAPDTEKQAKVRELLTNIFDKVGKDGSITLEQLRQYYQMRKDAKKKKADSK